MVFLQEVAKDIKKRREPLDSEQKERFVLVFPNKRSMKYFRYYYSQLLDKHEFIHTIPWQQFLDNVSGYTKAPQLTLLAYLFDTFKEIMGSEEPFGSYDFDKFFNIGQTILSDFNEIDNYLVDPHKIFLNIYELEKLNDLSFLSDEIKKSVFDFWQKYKKNLEDEFFVKLFSKLSDIYENFTNKILAQGLVYNGLRNKLIVNDLEQGQDLFTAYDKVAFIGFYALSASERKIWDFLKKQDKAIFYWDYDQFYLNQYHEAGFFLNKNLAAYPDALGTERNQILTDKNISVISVPRNVAQAKLLPQIFEKLEVDKNPDLVDKTAVILLDERLLFPVLYSLPDYIDRINITLQFPLRLTSLFSFFSNWFYVINGLIKNKKIYYKDLLKLLNTETFTRHFPELKDSLTSQISEKRSLYVETSQLPDDHIIFKIIHQNEPAEITGTIQQIIYHIYKNSEKFDREYIYAIYTEINALANLLEQNPQLLGKLTNDLILNLLQEIIYNIRVPFEGNTIKGLQVMTIMETRNLDFENVILLGMNEGIFPDISRPRSFLTESVRKFYNLPVLKYQDSLYAYMFYRLLHNAKNVYLLYNSIPDIGVEGVSRYVLQLENETDLIKEKLNYYEELNLKTHSFDLDPRTIRASGLKPPLKLSPSAITTYLACPRRFFYYYVAGLEAPSELSLELAVNEFGSIVHRTLELYYQKILEKQDNRIIRPQDIKIKSAEIDKLLETATQEILEQPVNLDQGEFILLTQSMNAYVRKILEFDKTIAPFELVSIEKQQAAKDSAYYYPYKVNDDLTVNLKGIIDRIHKKDGIYYIVDYKTGKKTHDIAIEKLFSPKDAYKASAIIQLLIYRLMINGLHPDWKTVPLLLDIPGMFRDKNFNPKISIKEAGNTILLDGSDPDKEQEIYETFDRQLKTLIEEIHSPEQSYPMTDYPDTCTYCELRDLCGR